MKTIIHIGQHKTGTTSIQRFLHDSRDALSLNGLYIPSTLAGYSDSSHFILNVYALNNDRFSSKKEEIINEKGRDYVSGLGTEIKRDVEKIYQKALQGRCDKVLWSNEGLYLLNTITEYKRLKNLFSEYSTEVEVVCCFRDVSSYKESYVKQLSKQKIPLSKNPDSYRYLESDSWLFDYKRKKELLAEVFDKCTYFSYSADNNVKRFMETIGINTIASETCRLNVTVSANKL